MGWNNGLMTWPIAIGDVSDALHWVSGYLGDIIENSTTINPWAKYKPVREIGIGLVNRTTTASLGFGDRPGCTTAKAFIDLYLAGDTPGSQRMNGWEYLKPRGKKTSSSPAGQTADEWFRLLDLVKVVNGEIQKGATDYGYADNTKAKNPFGNFRVSPSTVFVSGSNMVIQCARTAPYGTYPDYAIAINDLNGNAGIVQQMLYFGAMITGFSDSPTGCLLVGNKEGNEIGTDRGHENLNLNYYYNGGQAGSRYVYPFLTNKPFTGDNTDYGVEDITNMTAALPNNRIIWPIPKATRFLLNVGTSNIEIKVNAKQTAQTSSTITVNWGLRIKNNNASAASLVNGKVRFRFAGKSYNDTMVQGEVEENLSNQTIPANTEITVFSMDTNQKTGLSPQIEQVFVHFETQAGGTTTSWEGQTYIIKPYTPEA